MKVTLGDLEQLVQERTEELQKAYNSLKESEKGLAESQEMAHVGNMDWNLVTGEVYWSDELYRIFRRSPKEPGTTYDEFLKYVRPEDRENVDKAAKKALSGKPISGDYTIKLANGEERKVHTHIEVIFDEKYTPIRMKGTVQDVTELKKSEEKIRNLADIVESSTDAIGTISLEGTFISWNKGAEQIYSYSAQEILGMPVSFVTPSQLSEETRILIERVKQGESVNNYETLQLRKDGKQIDVSITLSQVRDLYGKVNAISFFSRDISKRMAIEKALAEIEISRKKEIHHRIKNNLQVVSSLLDLQALKFKGRNNIKDTEVIDAFTESENRVRSMALIHEELYKGGGFETINFSSYVEKLTYDLISTYKFEDTNIFLNKDLEEDLFFEMDTAIPLGTIINEVMSNSFKHAFHGREKGEIGIKLYREKKNELMKCREVNEGKGSIGTTYTLTISDNGIGIPENIDIQEIDSLGLQLVTSLVNQLDGELEIKRNSGTEFTIKFTVLEKNKYVSATVAQKPV